MQRVCYKLVNNEPPASFSGCAAGGGCGWVSPPAADRVLTAEGQQAGVGDWGLTQVQHLEHSEVFRQEPQAGVSKLWGTQVLSLCRPRGGDPKAGQEWEGVGSI